MKAFQTDDLYEKDPQRNELNSISKSTWTPNLLTQKWNHHRLNKISRTSKFQPIPNLNFTAAASITAAQAT